MNNRRGQTACALLFLLFLPSCGVLAPLVPEVEKPSAEIPIPEAWKIRITSGTDAHQWVRRFGDSTLNTLVAEGLRNNQNLRIAALRIEQLEKSELLTDSRQRPALSGSLGLSNSGRFTDGDPTENTNPSLSFSTGWEPDLWGQLKDERDQAALDTLEVQANYFAARLSLAGNITSAYFNLISAQNSMALAEGTLVNFQNSLRIIERSYKAGISGVDAVDVQLGRNNVTGAQRGISEAKVNLTNARQALEILLGRYPEGLVSAEQELPSPLSSLPSTIPAAVIEQRPDLISARTGLASLVKEVDIRRKEILPNINLRGSISGDNSASLTRLLDPTFLAWTVASTLSQDILDRGVNKASVEQALILHRIAIEQYSAEALGAFREVEFALLSDAAIAEQTVLLRKEVETSTLAERQAQRDYSSGLNIRILSVLESQRRAVNARAGLIRIQNERLQNQVDLFVAMGGNP